jgi:ABC-type dipeptide/oligopeptide/nickel transport system permease component
MKIKIFVFPVVIGILLVFLFVSIYYLRLDVFAPGGSTLEVLKKSFSKEVFENMVKKYHLDMPWYERYLQFLGASAKYNLGRSFQSETFTVKQMIAFLAPMSGLFMAIAGILILIALFLRSKKPYNTWMRLFQICALILLSVINMYFIYQYALKAVIATLVFIGCLLFLSFRRDRKIMNYASTVLVILTLFQLFLFEEILRIKGISFYLTSAALNRDYTLIWGVLYSMFLLAALTGVLVSYIGIYFKRN